MVSRLEITLFLYSSQAILMERGGIDARIVNTAAKTKREHHYYEAIKMRAKNGIKKVIASHLLY